jgi:very-short-patch-repair endonuclease
VSGYEVDFLIRGTPVVLECDGYESHGLNWDQFEFDRVRDAELTGSGSVIVHFTWRQLTRGPSHVARRIEANVAQWAPELLAAHRSRPHATPNWAT